MPIKGALENSTLQNLNVKMNINSNTHSQTGVWELGQKLTPLVSQFLLEKKQGFRPVGRDVLFPTSAYVTNKFHRSIETLYANIFCLYGLFLCANLRREEDIPTYRFSGEKQ